MNIIQVFQSDDLSETVMVLNRSHGTIAKEFGFSKETNPTNNAFINAETLKQQLNNGISLYKLVIDNKAVGCIAIEKSSREEGTYYIEKVSVLPEERNNNYGIRLMNFAEEIIRKTGGVKISIALINENEKLKKWYIKQGFKEAEIKKFPHLPFTVCFMNKVILP